MGAPAKPMPVVKMAAAPKLAAELEKYAKMAKMKIPQHAIHNKMRQDGLDPDDRWQEIQDFLDGKAKPVAAPPKAAPVVPAIDPKLEKYVKMLKMKIPEHA